MDAAGLYGLAPAFLAIDKDDGECDAAAVEFYGIDGFEGGAAGGDDVIDDNDVVAGLEISLDLFAGAMFLGFFADGEDLEGFRGIPAGGGHADGEGDGIGAEGHASDGMDGELFRMDFRADGVPAEVSDEGGSEGIEGGDAAIDVEIGGFPRSEGEGAGSDGFFKQEGFEICGCLKHGWMVDGWE